MADCNRGAAIASLGRIPGRRSCVLSYGGRGCGILPQLPRIFRDRGILPRSGSLGPRSWRPLPAFRWGWKPQLRLPSQDDGTLSAPKSAKKKPQALVGGCGFNKNRATSLRV